MKVFLLACVLLVGSPSAGKPPIVTMKPAKFAPKYHIIDLGTLGKSSQAHAINNKGHVVGESYIGDHVSIPNDETHAFLWQSGHMRDLGALPESETEAHNSKAFAINNKGQIVGGSGSYDVIPPDIGVGVSASPFLYSQGKMRMLGKVTDEGVPLGEAYAINDSGEIAGGAGKATVWRHGNKVWLGTLEKHPDPMGNDSESDAFGINSKGQVVGYALKDAKANITHPFLWQHGRMTDLHTPAGSANGFANAINDKGEVAGHADVIGESNSLTVWFWRSGKMHALPKLPGAKVGMAEALNNLGQIVGQSDKRATLWETGKIYDLNSLIPSASGWVLEDAAGINDHGQICGNGKHNGKERAFLLTPVLANSAKKYREGCRAKIGPLAIASGLRHIAFGEN